MNSRKIAYGCYSYNDNIRYESSSGGMFTVLAKEIISQGGVVYGTSLSDDCKQAFIRRVDVQEDLCYLAGSKYLQSNVGQAYQSVKQDLINGNKVLFTGCPCQVNGLVNFLGEQYENLICIDVICHGVPSPKLWRIYADFIESKKQIKLVHVNFRSKIHSWKDFGLKYNVNKKSFYSSKNENAFLQLFLRNYCLRPSCYECNSKKNRYADISLGDFWGIEKVIPELDDSKGTSLLIVRTKKGEKIIEQIKDQIKYLSCDYDQAVKNNTAEYQSVIKPPQRESFFLDVNKMSLISWKKNILTLL